MYKYLTILVPMIFSCCSGKGQQRTPEKMIGTGLLTVNTLYPVPLYKNYTDNMPFDTLKFQVAKSGVTSFISKIRLKPYVMSGGDSYEAGKKNVQMGLIRFSPELKFRVTDTTASFFKIVTNEETGETFIVKRNAASAYYTSEKELYDHSCSNCPGIQYNPKWYFFETWERYLKRVEFITKENLVIYDQPNGKIIFENREKTFLPFTVTAVKGEWIKLKKGFGREFNFDSSKNYDGWTKWLEGQQKVIDIVEHTYE
ncbi:hypothetical protein [Chitinophaga arvensicola]|uniref:Uncharacterized protein n=1 Tax=Chitinophaga arvensicola TaxID=29529 RepID=A0A1I0S9U9_9BACT|nr:hypothetical protein [Chitinophaga arvensicola]SEW52880.1 hypothetical protein SAMN04488122_5205 [Chitinophaga arvensicola]